MQTVTSSRATVQVAVARWSLELIGPRAVPWTAIGALWSLWVVRWTLGFQSVYWSALFATTMVWAGCEALDRLQRWRAIGSPVASASRVATVVLGVGWAAEFTTFHASVADAVPFVATVLFTAGFAALTAPALGGRAASPRSGALRGALTASGVFVFVGTFAMFVANRLGVWAGEEHFIHLVMGAATCVFPTSITATSALETSAPQM